jgi:hypothetical protein
MGPVIQKLRRLTLTQNSMFWPYLLDTFLATHFFTSAAEYPTELGQEPGPVTKHQTLRINKRNDSTKQRSIKIDDLLLTRSNGDRISFSNDVG